MALLVCICTVNTLRKEFQISKEVGEILLNDFFHEKKIGQYCTTYHCTCCTDDSVNKIVAKIW